MKLHMDRGADLLANQYKYSGGNLEKFLKNALKEGDANL
jgi:DNA sulfur modification protein DndE